MISTRQQICDDDDINNSCRTIGWKPGGNNSNKAKHGSLCKVHSEKQKQQQQETLCIIHPLFRRHVGSCFLWLIYVALTRPLISQCSTIVRKQQMHQQQERHNNNINNQQAPIVNVKRQHEDDRLMQESSIITGNNNTVASDDDAYYYETTTLLGAMNITATIGNPLKGFSVDPNYFVQYPYRIPTSLESFYYGMDNVLMSENVYNWSYFERTLNDTMSRNCQAIPRFFIHYPGEVLRLPYDILDKIKLVAYNDPRLGQGLSPDYSDPLLLTVIQNFIAEFGKMYDGDPRIAYIQLGILGFWGEGHTLKYDSIPNDVLVNFTHWYGASFNKTKLHIRRPSDAAIAEKMGYHDDSFAYQTLDGIYNGGKSSPYYFWSRVKSFNNTNFYQYGAMGGEIRPELKDIIFSKNYPANTTFHQDLMCCINITHTTNMRHVWFYRNGNDNVKPYEYERAIYASSHMGYNFYIPQLKISQAPSKIFPTLLNVHILVQQVGIAPFYYPLNVVLDCRYSNDGQHYSMSIENISQLLINQYDSEWFTFTNVPATESCLSNISITLQSDMVYDHIPIRWAQGTNGLHVNIALPLPGSSWSSSPSAGGASNGGNTPPRGSSTDAPSTHDGSMTTPNRPTSAPSATDFPHDPTTQGGSKPPTGSPTVAPSYDSVVIIKNNHTEVSTSDLVNNTGMSFTLVDANTDADIGPIESGDTVLLPFADGTIRNKESLLSIRVNVSQLSYIAFSWMNDGFNRTISSKKLTYAFAMDGDVSNRATTIHYDEYDAIPYLSKKGPKEISVTATRATGIREQATLLFVVADSTTSSPQPQENSTSLRQKEVIEPSSSASSAHLMATSIGSMMILLFFSLQWCVSMDTAYYI